MHDSQNNIIKNEITVELINFMKLEKGKEDLILTKGKEQS